MKRSLALIALLTVILGNVPARASDGNERSVTFDYTSPVVGIAWPSYQMHDCGVFVEPTNSYLVQGCSTPRIRGEELFVSVATQDATGIPVALKVFQWAAGAGGPPRYIGKDACSEMPPWKLRPWATYMWIEVLAGPCADGTPALGTRGTITTTFYKAKP